MKAFLQKHLDDVLITAGAGMVTYGTYILAPVAALFVAGVFLIVAGVLVGMGGSKR